LAAHQGLSALHERAPAFVAWSWITCRWRILGFHHTGLELNAMIETRSLPIVVGIDGSTNSLVALRWALREGGVRGVPVEVIHCWQAQLWPGVVFGPVQEMHTGSMCMVQNEIAAALVDIHPRPDVIQTSIKGQPVPTLLARSARASLIVLGAHGHTNLRDRLFGQVADSCLRRANCPVVVIDRDGNESSEHRLGEGASEELAGLLTVGAPEPAGREL
jgi:nucleotide-binding universal stress UspA family protein